MAFRREESVSLLNEDVSLNDDTVLPDGHGNYFTSTLNMVNAALGAGVLAFPYAFKSTGLGLGLIVTFCLVLICGYSLHIVARATDTTKTKSYQEVVEKLLGKRWGMVIEIILLLYLWGAIIAYMKTVGDLVPPIIQHYLVDRHHWSHGVNRLLTSEAFIIAAFAIVLMLPLCCLKRVDILGPGSFLAILSCLYLAVFVTWDGAKEMKSRHENHTFSNFNWNLDFFAALPLVLFALASHILVPPVYAEYRNRSVKRMDIVILSALAIELLIYMPVAIFGYVNWGNCTYDDILMNYDISNVPATVGKACVVLTVTLATPINLFPARLAFASLFFKGKPMTPLKFYGITFFIFFSCLGVAILVSGIGIVFSIIGSTLGVAIILFFPSAFAWKLRRDSNKTIIMTFIIIAIVVGIIIGVSGTSHTIYTIVKPPKNPCYDHDVKNVTSIGQILNELF